MVIASSIAVVDIAQQNSATLYEPPVVAVSCVAAKRLSRTIRVVMCSLPLLPRREAPDLPAVIE